MIVGARGSLDLIHAESDRRAETRGQTPPGANVPHSVVKVAMLAERARCAMIAENVAGAASRANPRGASGDG
jgi:hypothetical protein